METIRASGMTVEELLSEAKQASDEGALFELPGKDAYEILKELDGLCKAMTEVAGHLGLDAANDPSPEVVAAVVKSALLLERRKGREEMMLASLNVLESEAPNGIIKSRTKVAIQNALTTLMGGN